jgi:hypothetical protein
MRSLPIALGLMAAIGFVFWFHIGWPLRDALPPSLW